MDQDVDFTRPAAPAQEGKARTWAVRHFDTNLQKMFTTNCWNPAPCREAEVVVLIHMQRGIHLNFPTEQDP